MLARKSAQLLVASSSKLAVRRGPHRCYTQKPIWDSDESGWDHVFKDLDVDPSPARLLASSSQRRPSRGPSRRLTMTAREVSVFDQMFDTIFNSYVESGPHRGNDTQAITGVGKSHSSLMDELTSQLRQHSRNMRWTSEEDQELDRKREEMDLCDTDQQLLDWAMREVFRESERYEEEARKAMESNPSTNKVLHLQPPFYPYLIADLMKTFRDKYGDPYLALSIFDHARHLSIASYVFGCTTKAYNELIATRWKCFRDVRGVCDALEEMRVNGIEMDSITRRLAESVRADVGGRNIWEEESSLRGEEVRGIVRRIEQLTANPKSSRNSRTLEQEKPKWLETSESWKQNAIQEGSRDGWEFGKWDNVPSTAESVDRVWS